MKTTVLISTIIGSLLTIAITQLTENTGTSDNQWIVSPRYLTLQDGVEKEEAREFLVNEYLNLYKELPGFNAAVGEPERGDVNVDFDFVMIYTFDSKWTRDHYFPEEDVYSDEVIQAVEKYQDTYDKLFGYYFKEEQYSYKDFLMFARAK